MANRGYAENEDSGTMPAHGAGIANWHHDLRSGATEYSSHLSSWLGLANAQGASLDPLLRAMPERERSIVEDLLRGKSPGYRSLSHPLESASGPLLVHHQIGFDPDARLISGSLLDISARTEIDSALAVLARMVSRDDDEFFRTCVQKLACVYGVRFAFIALVDESSSHATTLSVWSGDRHVDNFTYALAGTPCQDVMNHRKELIPARAAALYPQDALLQEMEVDSYFGSPLYDASGRVFGIISIMDTSPMNLSSWTEPILGVFSSRVSVELLRQRELEDARAREELLRVERERARRFEALGTLGGSVAHDFQNLLTVVSLNVEALQELSLGPEAQQHLAEIVEAGHQARTLSERLLSFGRKTDISPQPIDLNAAIRSQLPLLRRLVGNDVALQVGLCDAEVTTVFDRGEFQQILFNLVINARDAMPGGGTIIIETEKTGDSVALRIRDTGHGIPASIRHRIFEPHFTTKESRGTGLGLATVFNILRSVGGRIDVLSEEGVGTTMEVEFVLQAG